MARANSPQLKLVTEAIAYAQAAKAAGVPRDQLINFGRGQYSAQPKQLVFHAACRLCDADDGPDQIGFGGARGPGKSHALFAQVALDDCQRFAGLKVLYLRKVSKNAREQFEDLRKSVLRYTPHGFNRSTGVLTFPNESVIIIGHFKNESDVDQYLGIEYDLIVIEEATTLSASKYKTLRDSNRTSKQGWRPRIYTSTNPGNIGHAWFKERFITPARTDKETWTRFIFSTLDDNAFIDKGYARKVEENTGWKLRAYRYGDWDIAAGQYFSTWHHDSIMRPWFKAPAHWTVWAAMDYGFTHPTVVYLLAENDGKIYVLDEHRQAKWLPSQHAPAITAMFERNGVKVSRLTGFVAGADVFANKGDEGGKTIDKQYAEHGLKLTPAVMDRINGWGEVLQLLGDPMNADEAKRRPPAIEISDRCKYLIECIPALQHNPNKPEDVLKWDVDEDGNGGDDPADALRYGVIFKKKAPAQPAAQSYSLNYRR